MNEQKPGYFNGAMESITNNSPNYWVIKGRSDQNDWANVLVPGESSRWHEAKPPKTLESGDRIFCWESGARRMVGLAELVSPDTGQNKNGETLFEVRYLTRRFAAMPTIEELRQVPVVESASFLKNRLECEVCGFDFAGVYGPRGSNYCEVHHLKPLSNVHAEVETRLQDLAIVCSNCHRMLHRQPWTDIPGLRASLQHS